MLDKKKHIQYIKDAIETKDLAYYSTEQSRIFTIYWTANSLKILKDDFLFEIKQSVIELVKSSLNKDGGFGGNIGLGSTILSTFHALQLLWIYGIPFYSKNTINFILNLQSDDGSFENDEWGEKDTRFDCCAVLSLHLISIMKDAISRSGNVLSEEVSFYPECELNENLLSKPISEEFIKEIGFDKTKSIMHILNCYNLDGGFGQIIGSESHAAQIFCCVSVLRVLDALVCVDVERINDFLVYRQCPNGGLNGRLEKKEDVCYSFWALAALIMIGSEGIDKEALKAFIYSCEGENGGFSDRSGNEPDLYHLMFSIASLGLLGEEGLKEVDPGFCL